MQLNRLGHSLQIDPTVLQVLEEKRNKEFKIEQQEIALTEISKLRRIQNADWDIQYLNGNAEILFRTSSKIASLKRLIGLTKPVPSPVPSYSDLMKASETIREKIKFIGIHDTTLDTLKKYELFSDVAKSFNVFLTHSNNNRKPDERLSEILLAPTRIYIAPPEYAPPREYADLSIEIPQKETNDLPIEMIPLDESFPESASSPVAHTERKKRKALPSPKTPPPRQKNSEQLDEFSKKSKKKPKTEKKETEVVAPTARRSQRLANKKTINEKQSAVSTTDS